MTNVKKLLKKSIHLFCFFILYCIITKESDTPESKSIDRFLPDIKYLLLWTPIHGIFHDGQKHFIEKKCPKINCYFTRDKQLLDNIKYYDAIIFNLQDVSNGIQQLPGTRGHYQKYIFAANDSSDNYPVCDPVYDKFFNWTWSYRSTSTIPYKFITAYNEDKEEIGSHFSNVITYKSDVIKQVTNKSIAAATFLDKCNSRSKREVFITELMKQLSPYNLTLDVFGECGRKCRKKTMKPCFWKLKKLYFFYLALEDSFDEDYVTQDVLYAYDNKAIPIVYGKADYERFLPPNSFLDAVKLGVEKLAKVMYDVVSNHSRYKGFFKFQHEYSVRKSDVFDVCQLCLAINNPHWLTYDVTYNNFREWWNPNYTTRCLENK